jgi:phosphate-selective porin OprO and OprP
MCGRDGRRAGAALLSTLLLGLSAAMAAEEPPRRPWNELDTSWVSARLGFAAMEDGAFYSQDAANKQQVGDLSAEQLFRLDDLSVSGVIKLPRPWKYVLAGNYRGLDTTESRTWTFTDVNLSVPIGQLANVTIGKQKEGLGLEMTENARDVPFMQLSVMSTASTFFESHVVGVRFSNAILGGRMTWSGGWFNNWLDDDLSFSESGQIFAGRVTGLAMDQDGGRELLHLGVSAVYREAPNGSFKSKSIPEVYEAPDFVDTGSFPANHATSVAGELAAVQDAFTLSAEYTATYVSSPQTGNPEFAGFYVMTTYALTGETRPYDHESGTFGMIRPSAPFSFKHGGCGAWEVGARYSKIDLTSGAVDGGVFDRWSGALSWYPTAQWRFEFNYGYGRLDKAGLVGHTNFYQLRLQFQL